MIPIKLKRKKEITVQVSQMKVELSKFPVFTIYDDKGQILYTTRIDKEEDLSILRSIFYKKAKIGSSLKL